MPPRSPDGIARGLFGGRSTRGGTADSGRSDTPESRGGRYRRGSDDSGESSPRNGRRRNSTPNSPTRNTRRRGFGVRSASPDETFVGGRQRRRTVGGVGGGKQSGRTGSTRTRAYQSGGSAGSDYRGGSLDSEDVIDRSESSTASSSGRRSHLRSKGSGEKKRVASAGAVDKNKGLPAIYTSRGSAGSKRSSAGSRYFR